MLFFFYFLFFKILYCNICFKLCFKNFLCADIFSSYYLKNFYIKKEHFPPNLNFIINNNNSICLKDKDFSIYLNDNENEFNLSEIFSEEIYKSNSIRIVHKSKNNNNNKVLCVFGVLESDIGLKIEIEMLEWLILNYDVYCVYQDYPGKYFEYPALRFAQWIIKKKKRDICLYIHTKGAGNNHQLQVHVRNCWKNEYSGINKFKYINPIKNNITDITSIISSKERILWFNGFFINKNAFEIIGEIKFLNHRHHYEGLFIKYKQIRTLGILKNNATAYDAIEFVNKYINEKYKIKYKRKYYKYLYLILVNFLKNIINVMN